MSTRYIALTGSLLAVVFLAHAAARFTQIGGGQVAPGIAVYAFIALLLGPELAWGPLAIIGILAGVLMMLATSSPFPLANVDTAAIAFLACCAIAKVAGRGGREIGLGTILGTATFNTLLSWTIFSATTWIGLSSTGFASRSFKIFGLTFGNGYVAFWLFGFVGVIIPTLILSLILVPLLYRAVRPALIRQGMIEAAHPSFS
jgi:hypothetical protein